MAITIDDTPGARRWSGQPIVWVVSSDKTDEKEFAYRVDIKVDGTSILSEFLVKQANPTGNLIIDLQHIIDNELSPEVQSLMKSTATNRTSTDSVKDFEVLFGEQYQNSSGVLTGYTGASTETVGDPSIKDDTNITVIKGAGDSQDLDVDDAITVGDGYTLQADGLKDGLNEEFRGGQYVGDYVHFTYWDASDGTTKTYSEKLTTAGTHTVTLANDGTSVYSIQVGKTYTGDFGKTHFIWWYNGGWHQFNATEELIEDVSIERMSAKQSNIVWGGSNGGIRDNKNNSVFKSGINNYANSFMTEYTRNTQWLDDDQAAHLKTLFFSRDTYIQDGDNLIPIEITNGTIPVKRRTRQDNLFQYAISYRYTNDKPTI